MERIDAIHRELDDTENSPELMGQAEAAEVNLNTQEEQMLAVVQEDPEPVTPENEQVEDDSNTGATNQPEEDSRMDTTTNTPVQRIEALKVH